MKAAPLVDRLAAAAGRTTRLSVCCMAAGDGARAAAALAPYRSVADEIVVALDDRADDAAALALAAVADRVIPFPYAEPVDRPLPWLVGRCSGDWVLVVDDDEVPSAALLDALPGLVAADDVTHYWLARRWLYPDESSWLDEPPWRPDFQLRLVTADPRLLHFPDETHRPIEALGPHRFLDLPLYHADCLLKTPEERLAKARRYERLRPGKRIAGRPMNHAFHLPERHPGPRLASVPDGDRALVVALLSPPAAAIRPAGTIEAASTREEIDALWPGRGLAEEDYRARLEPLDAAPTLRAGEQRALEVRVTNEGGAVWPWGEDGHPPVRVAYHWLDGEGRMAVLNGLRTPFPADVRPGEEALVPVHVLAPEAPGGYELELDLVHERVRWFDCSVRVPATVVPAPRTALAGDPTAVEAALERLNEEEPEVEPLVVEPPGDLPPRFGPPRAPDLHAYLFDGAPERRPLWAPVLAARTAALLRSAHRRRRGRASAPLPRGAEGLLAALERCHALRLVADEAADTWALWERAALAATARALGVRVELADGALPPAGGPVDTALARVVRALAE